MNPNAMKSTKPEQELRISDPQSEAGSSSLTLSAAAAMKQAREGFRSIVDQQVNTVSKSGIDKIEIVYAADGKQGFTVKNEFVDEAEAELIALGYAVTRGTTSTGATNFKVLRITF